MLATKEKSHPGFQLPTAALHPGFGFAISNTSTGLADPLYDFRSGPRSSGYFRDSETGLDYAKNRYHQPGMGRFMSVDPYKKSAGPQDPGSWNRYAYTRGDPVNRRDKGGTCDSDEFSFDEDSENCDGGDGGGGGDTCDSGYYFDETTGDCEPDGGSGGEGGSQLSVDGETGGHGAGTQVLKWIPKALKKLTKFKVKSGSPCATDLSKIGLSQATIQTDASTVPVLDAESSNPEVFAALEKVGGDFGVITGSSGPVYYDPNYFWQSSVQMVMATLIHEFSHVGGYTDEQDQKNLGLIVGAPTANISKKIATDCFNYKGPIE